MMHHLIVFARQHYELLRFRHHDKASSGTLFSKTVEFPQTFLVRNVWFQSYVKITSSDRISVWKILEFMIIIQESLFIYTENKCVKGQIWVITSQERGDNHDICKNCKAFFGPPPCIFISIDQNGKINLIEWLID